MKILKTVFLVVFLFASSNIFSQNQDIARAYYIKAKEAFANEQYGDVVRYLEEARNELGATNPDIIYLELMAMYNRNKTNRQVGRLATEFMEKADRSDDRLQKVSLIAVEHKELIEAEKRKERDLYNQAVNSKNLSSLRKYLQLYRTNKDRVKNVEDLIKQMDDQQFLQAKKSMTVNDLQQYKSDFPRGNNVAEVNNLLKTAREEELYAKAKNDDNISLYKSYLIQYPNGKFADEVTMALEAAMINEANTKFENEEFHRAKISYQAYMKQFPSSDKYEFIDSRLNEIDKKVRQDARRSMRTSSKYLIGTYNTGEEWGVEYGGLHLNKLATYLNLSGNKSVFDLTFATDELTDSVHEDFEKATISAGFGLTYNLGYPLWIYAGGGVKYTEYFTGGTLDRTTYEINDRDPYQFFPEAGLQVRILQVLTMKAGAMFLNDEVVYRAGFGFAL